MIELNKIYNEDCLEGMKRIPDGSVDLVVTSPPYFNARDYSHWDDYETYLGWLESVFCILHKKMKDGRMVCVNVSPVLVPRANRNEESRRLPIPFDLHEIMKRVGFKFLDDIIWLKPEGAAINRNGKFYSHRKPVAYKPNVVTEYILVYQKPFNGLIDDIIKKVPNDIMQESLVNGDYERSNVWQINPERKSDHPAPYPVRLVSNLIRYYSYCRDSICDPFMGSGTTAIAAIRTKRNFIGFELQKEYYDIANKRIKEEQMQLSLF